MRKLYICFLAFLCITQLSIPTVFAARHEDDAGNPSPTSAPVQLTSSEAQFTPTPTTSVIAPTSIPSQTPVSVTPTDTLSPTSTPSQLTPTETPQPTSSVLGSSTTPTLQPSVSPTEQPTVPPPFISPNNVKIATIAGILKTAPIIKNIITFPADFFSHTLPNELYTTDGLSLSATLLFLLIAACFFLGGILLIWPKFLIPVQKRFILWKEHHKLRKGQRFAGI